MYYQESGSGSGMALLHGNPGSSPLWRNVILESRRLAWHASVSWGTTCRTRA
jgi:hypothetical protein